ncbi:MAG: hypothetical protein C4547_10915 [Phycisphaerales bacterium]|nr:MAG: hypothetical protein C4547_10915 [Phycisphaerales bacterium]
MRTTLYALFTNLHALVTIPLAVGLAVHLLFDLGPAEARAADWTLSHLVVCTGCVTGIIVFAGMAVVGLTLSVVYGWRGR